MLKLIPPALLLLIACGCGGVSEVPGLPVDPADDDGEVAAPDGDDEGTRGHGGDDGSDADDAGTGAQPYEDAGEAPEADAGPEVEGANVRLGSTSKFDDFLTDEHGRALYVYVTDAAGAKKTTCAGTCADAWPPFSVDEVVAGNGLASEDFERFKRDDGAWQVAYKGRPLYYHTGDDDTLDVSGDGIDERWFVARDYTTFFYSQSVVRPEGSPAFNTPFLTDGLGRTLYVYLTDTPGDGALAPVSTCTAEACVTKWPVWSDLGVIESPILPSNMDGRFFGSYMRDDGSTQVTYRGWPLYYFDQDDTPGEAAGHNVNDWRAFDPLGFGAASP